MANWRPVYVSVWNDRKFLACGDDARLLWLFLLTCPSLPIPGIVIGGDATLAEMLGWDPERLRERFAEIARNGLQVAREGRIVWLRNALKYQRPSNPNMVKAWAKKWDDVPEGELKLELWEALKTACKSWSVLFGKLFAKPFETGSENGSHNRSDNGSTHYNKNKNQHDHQNDLGRDLARPGDLVVAPSAPKPSRPPRSERAVPLPADWAPRADEIALARELRVDPTHELAAFRDHHTARGSRFVDWNAAFRTWLRNAVKFNRGGDRTSSWSFFDILDSVAAEQRGQA